VNYVMYEEVTGEILQYGFCNRLEDFAGVLDIGVSVLAGVGRDTEHYVQNGVINPRPEMPITIDGNTLTVPINTTFKVNGFQDVTTDGVLEFDFSEPGVYNVHLSLWPYKDVEVTLEG
jgi:hypothetical protein